MSFSIPKFHTFTTISPNYSRISSNLLHLSISTPQFSKRNANFGCRYGLLSCYAAAKQHKSGGAAPPPTTTKKKKKPTNKSSSKRLVGDDFEIEKSGGGVEVMESPSESESPYSALPPPPAGFVLDEQGRVLLASNKRIATIVDSINNFPLECVIRRVFRNSRGDECMLLCPVDTPVQILKSVNVEGWSAVSDEEVEAILPTAAYALAKIHMHLVHSGFCYTARGGFCYTEEDIFEFHIDNGEDVDGLPTEGVEIACFHLDGSHYMIYTPSDPLLFVAVKDKNGVLQMADDELLDDPAIISAIDEETEFNALVEEEAALLDSLIGKR
ncbi:BTB/POZ domain protein TNFAIP protein [Perilla frutescens var. frutescens]|nr:BTB/POZ domain protein TNFAIP protein [Perilla frutescens var. frutescens]